MTEKDPNNTQFKQLLERSDEVFRKVRGMVKTGSKEMEAIKALETETRAIADEARSVLDAKQFPQSRP